MAGVLLRVCQCSLLQLQLTMCSKTRRIRNLNSFLPTLAQGRSFRAAVEIDKLAAEALLNVGFGKNIKPGDTIVPGAVGPISAFNANGRDVKRKDLPKEEHPFHVYRSWQDWHGQTHWGVQHRSVMAYQIEHIHGQVESVTIAEKDGKFYAVSRVMENTDADGPNNLHVVNLFLEIFGRCDILDDNISMIAVPKLRSLNWRVLPKGAYPWERAKTHFQEVTRLLPEERRSIVEYRLHFLSRFQPDFIALGEGGFMGYFVLGFSGRPLFVFESIYLGNATYVFDKDWEVVSKMTKADILRDGLQKYRVVHTWQWEPEMKTILS